MHQAVVIPHTSHTKGRAARSAFFLRLFLRLFDLC
nr:MAG TPA: hypothetical protein [Caudoviricetes sp.]